MFRTLRYRDDRTAAARCRLAANVTQHANAYEQVVTKHLELTNLVSQIAAEGRTPTDTEKQRIETLRGEVETIQKSWESDGRKAFLASLQTTQSTNNGPLVLKAEQRYADVVKSLYPAEWQHLSLGRFLRGYVTGNWSGAELEMKAMASTPASAGGVLIPAVLGARVIDLARNTAVTTRAGAQVVPMTSNNLKLARQTADAAVGWYAEGADITETDATFDSVDFAAKKMACLVRVSNELVEDAPNFESVLEGAIAAAMASELDRAAIEGTGASNQPKGIINWAGINAVATIGTPTNYDKFLDGVYAVRSQNFTPNAMVAATRTYQKLGKLKTGITNDNTPLAIPPDFAALAKFETNAIPINLGAGTNESYAVIGQFNELLIGLRSEIMIEVSREAGTAFGKDQTLIRARWRGDVQLAHAKAFCHLSGITGS